MKRNLRNILLALLFAAATPLLAPAAQAQGMFMPFGHHADKLAAKLKLTPEQKTQWDAMLAKTTARHQAMRQQHEEMRAAMKAELAKPEPDLAALAARADAARDQGRAAHKELRDGWLALYATMSTEQKGVVKAAIQHHMSRMGKMRERMHGERGEHGGYKPADAPPAKG